MKFGIPYAHNNSSEVKKHYIRKGTYEWKILMLIRTAYVVT